MVQRPIHYVAVTWKYYYLETQNRRSVTWDKTVPISERTIAAAGVSKPRHIGINITNRINPTTTIREKRTPLSSAHQHHPRNLMCDRFETKCAELFDYQEL